MLISALVAAFVIYVFELPSILYAVVIIVAFSDMILLSALVVVGVRTHDKQKSSAKKGIQGVVKNDP